MKTIITEEMRFREKVVKFAIKHGNNAEAARRYHTSRQQVQRWRIKYDGTTKSLANKSTRPKSHPNQHTEEELKLIKEKHKRFAFEGLAQVYRKLLDAGYTRSFGSMQRQLRNIKAKPQHKAKRYPKSKFTPLKGTFPGEFVEIDIKFVPSTCIGFSSDFHRYYQITAIDLFSRKRVLKLVAENSTWETSNFLYDLEKEMGFKIRTVQTDNGREFCNDENQPKSRFELVLEQLGIEHKRTRPYSPWQNGVVERSHRVDDNIFYSKRRFSSEEELRKSFERYATRTNNISKTVLKFKTPNEIVTEYYENVA